MPQEEINLISDTVTKPTAAMLEYMMRARVGDDVFGADPTVIELQKQMAHMFGMEAALFFPSGTMANQCAINLLTVPASQIICDKWAHVYNFEGGGASFNSGVSCKLIDGDRGMFTAAQVESAVHDPENYHLPLTKMVAIENSTNKGGGACWNFSELERIKAVCVKHNLGYHLDGARLFNALSCTDETPQQYGAMFDTISICLSKGLGAPVGSVLIGSEQLIQRAVRVRKLFGGAMRQVGYLAAAGIFALDHHIDRLAEDHRRARALGTALEKCSWVESVEPIETNIVIFYLKNASQEQEFIEILKKNQILIISMGEGKLRMVTHMEFTDEQLSRVEDVLEKN